MGSQLCTADAEQRANNTTEMNNCIKLIEALRCRSENRPRPDVMNN